MFKKKDLKDGDIVTYRKGDKRTVKGEKLIDKYGEVGLYLSDYDENLKDKFEDKRFDIVKVERPVKYQIVYEYKPEILDEVEKRYLKEVIRPYLDRIKSIEKFIFSTGRAKIEITVKDDDSYWHINLPPFEKDTMYKNMEEDKGYTLEELGL